MKGLPFFKKKLNRDVTLIIMALAVLAFMLARALLSDKTVEEIIQPKVSVLVFDCYWKTREEITQTLVNEYEDLNPGVKIELNFLPYDVCRNELSASDSAADVITVDPRWTAELAGHNTTEPEIYPILSFFYPLFYNIDILEKAGFSRPPKTRSEFLDQAKKITALGTDVYAAALALDPDSSRGLADVYSWIWAGGNTVLALAPLRETLDFLASLQNGNMLYPGTLDADETKQAFLDGKIAFMIGSAEDMESVRSVLGQSFGYTTVPAPDNYSGKPYFASGVWSLAITKDSSRREEALSFINFLSEKNSVLAEGWAVPENGNAAVMEDPFYSKATELYISGQLVENFTGIKTADADKVFSEEIIKLFNGSTGDETARNIINRLQ